ncbi:MAG TPA: hypothetical protein VF868_13560 [Bacteroidia bacterium]|jgi:hypothetical protein
MRLLIILFLAGAPFAVSFFNSNKESSGEIHEYFMTQLHLGNYDSIPVILEKLHKARINDPEDARINADLGFVNLWQFSERGRNPRVEGIERNVFYSNYFFKEAIKYDPSDPRLKGFQSATQICEGALTKDANKILNGYMKGFNAIKEWPQFNKFALSLVSSQLPKNSFLFTLAVKYQWELLDDCSCREVTKKEIMRSPDLFFKNLVEEMKTTKDPLIRRACWNTEIAPHNYEGYLLNFGDMLVKSGNVEDARKIYSAARLSPTYQDWVYRPVLEKRIVMASRNKKDFSKMPDLKLESSDQQMFINSPMSCTGCHQMSRDEFARNIENKFIFN